jgi:hypothetical protein
LEGRPLVFLGIVEVKGVGDELEDGIPISVHWGGGGKKRGGIENEAIDYVMYIFLS